MDTYTWVIILTTIGFAILAAALLVPVYLFLGREEQISQNWTPEALAQHATDPSESDLEEQPN